MDSIRLPAGVESARLQAFDTAHLRASAARASADQAGLAETARKLESVFSTLLVKEMRRPLGDGFFGEGADGDIYSGWLDEHVGEALARRGALNLGEMIQRSLLHRSEATS